MARGTEVGVGYVSIVPSAKDFARALTAEINPKRVGEQLGRDIDDGISKGLGKDPVGDHVEKSAKRGRSALDGMLGGFTKIAGAATIAGGAIGVFGKEAFDAFSDQAEATSKAQRVFGDAFGRIDAFAAGAAKALGQSRAQALEASATFGNLFRAMGLGTDQSADLSTSLVTLASDLASFNNVDPTETLLALRSGLLGEAEPMRRFGANLSEARIQAEALRLGLVKTHVSTADVMAATSRLEKAQAAANAAMKAHGAESVEYRAAQAQVALAEQAVESSMAGKKVELDAATKAQAAYSIITKDTALAQGDFAATADGAANSMRQASSQWDDLKAQVGEQLAPVGFWLLGGLKTSLDWLSDWWTVHGPTVKDGLTSIGDWFTNTFGEDPVANFQTGAKIMADEWNRLFGDFENGSIIIADKLTPAWSKLGEGVLWVKDEVLDPLWGSLQQAPEFFGFLIEGLETALDWVFKLGEPLGWVVDKLEGLSSTLFPSMSGGQPEGFASGGVVGGPVGAPRLALVHGGETVLPTHRAAYAGLRGVTPAMVAPASTAPMVGTMTVNGQPDPAATAWAIRRELTRTAFYSGVAYQ